jgi:hypothetical protein
MQVFREPPEIHSGINWYGVAGLTTMAVSSAAVVFFSVWAGVGYLLSVMF